MNVDSGNLLEDEWVLCLEILGLDVLSVAMSSQVNLSLESSRTEFARKRLITGVFAGMCYQVRGLTERFATDDTLVWLFAGVYIRMLFHV